MGSHHRYDVPAREDGSPWVTLDGLVPDTSACKNVGIAFALTLLCAVAELVGGVMAGSTAVISAAWCAVSDSITMALAWLLERVALRQSNARYSYGYRRLSLLSAVVSGIFIFIAGIAMLSHVVTEITGIEIFHWGRHDQHEHEHSPNSVGMFALAIFGIVINIVSTLVLRQGRTANEKMLIWHIMTHTLSWLSILVVAAVMMFVDMPLLDPLLSVGIVVFILHNAGSGLWEVMKLFLQAVPGGVEMDKLYAEVRKRVDGIVDMHDVRIWSLDGTAHVFSAHVVVAEDTSIEKITTIKKAIRDILAELGEGEFYTTIEFESANEICLAKVWGKT